MLGGSSESADKSRGKLRAADVRKQILSKYMKNAEETEKSASDMSEKSFDNLDLEALSPRSRSPMFDSKKLERMEKELAAERTRLHNVFGRMFFHLNCIFGMKYFFLLPLTFIHNGGWYFLLPLLVCAFVLAMPVVFLELILGQFTSQLGTQIFTRISPIAVGIGLTLPFVRVLVFMYFKTEHRIVSLIWDMVQQVFFHERSVNCWGQHEQDCWIPEVCRGENEVFFQGSCYNREYLWKTRRISSQQNVRLAAHGLYQSNFFYDDAFVRPVPHVDRILNADELAHKFDGIATFFIIAFLFSLLGVRRLTRVMPFFHGLLGLALVTISITMVSTPSSRESFKSFLSIMNEASDGMQLVSPTAWCTAAAMAMSMLAVGDGTLHALGALNHFNNNLIKDVMIIMGSWLGLVVFSVPFFGSIFVSGISTQCREEGTGKDELSNITTLLTQMKQYPYQQTAVHPLYYFHWSDMLSQYVGYALFIILFLVQIPAHVLMAENMMTIMMRLYNRLQNLHKAVIRHCLMFVYFVFMAVVYCDTLDQGNKELAGYAISFLALALASWECLTVRYLYSIDRILVNIRTMFEKHPKAFQLARSLARPLYVLWGLLIPVVAGGLFLMAMFFALMRMLSTNMIIIFIVLVAFLPVYMAGWTVIKFVLRKTERAHNLFRPTLNWGPFTVKDKKNANYDERAARLFR